MMVVLAGASPPPDMGSFLVIVANFYPLVCLVVTFSFEVIVSYDSIFSIGTLNLGFANLGRVSRLVVKLSMQC